MAARTHQFLLVGDPDGQNFDRWGVIYTEGETVATALRPDIEFSEQRLGISVDDVREYGRFLLEIATLMDAALEAGT